MKEIVFTEPPAWNDLWDALDGAGCVLYADKPGEVRAYWYSHPGFEAAEGPAEMVERTTLETARIPTGEGVYSRRNAEEMVARIVASIGANATKDRDYFVDQDARWRGEHGRQYEAYLGRWFTVFVEHPSPDVQDAWVSIGGTFTPDQLLAIAKRLESTAAYVASLRRARKDSP